MSILPKTGRPLIGSHAFRIWKLEQDGKPEEAQAYLDAVNRVNRAFGRADYDIAADWTAGRSDQSFALIAKGTRANVEQ